MTASTPNTTSSKNVVAPLQRRICVAPMLDWTDRYCRYFLRLISQHSVLYTEMITTGAILHGDTNHHLAFDKAEHPLALQLGGSDPAALAACAKIAAQYGYDEINLNCGCPSDRVQKGRFGACLMKEPELVAQCITAMKDAVDMPVTLKHRIGVDNQTSHAQLENFVGMAKDAGCDAFIVHARNALLQGLSPKDNRTIPPLIYKSVYRLKHSFPDSEFIINGGIDSIEQIKSHLEQVDGVMLGREAYHNPYLLAQMDGLFYGCSEAVPTRLDVLQRFLPFAERALANGARLHHLTRHILGLFHGQPGARKFRRLLSEKAHRDDAGIEVLLEALALMSDYCSASSTGQDKCPL
ncbi:MAG: tRNA dihydrouridine(20/20a) synthase DusA [Gammaproteobacteria bacterium]|nr:tRNA dihydrouridine(20/20a) synthase DusA [Gammaproteobacteria bacterium]MBQ0840185.1 tRNA dihydrouridine(20/20a) synthase DusA [Gammaproteobacteria bacterium]